MKKLRLAIGAVLCLSVAGAWGADVKWQLDFGHLEGTGATLRSGATVVAQDGFNYLDLGSSDGYLDLGATAGQAIGALSDFSVATYLYIPAGADITANGNFIFTFAYGENSGGEGKGYLFLNAKDTRYAISRTNWTGESGVSAAQLWPCGEWHHLAYTQESGVGRVYVDGVEKARGDISISPADLVSESGPMLYNYLGRSCYNGDAYLKGARYCGFSIYDGALTAAEVKQAADQNRSALNDALFIRLLEQAASALTLGDTDALIHDLALPKADGNVSISWATSDASVITAEGRINRPGVGKPDAHATLTATLSINGASITKDFPVTVLARLDAAGRVQYDLDHIVIKGNIHNLYSDLALPTTTPEGSSLLWKSNRKDYLSDAGKLNKLASKGEEVKVILTAYAMAEGEKGSREFEVTIGQEEDYSAYLFVYFTGNAPAQEQICYALSADGYSYSPLNNGDPVISSEGIALKKSVRDPHILRGEDGYFYMVATDMRSDEGWASNDGLVLMRSADMVNWTAKAIDFPTAWPARFDRDDLTQVWAPQTIFDPEAGKYMVYYSIGMRSQNHYKIFYSYANEDFTELTEPELLFDLGAPTIDADIVWADGLYHLFFKTEGEGGIQKATAPSLKGPWTPGHRFLQQTTDPVEGSGVFRRINSDEWVLMYDCYVNGKYQFCVSKDLENFSYVCNTAMSGKFTPRHGTVMPITPAEAALLLEKFPSTSITAAPRGAANRMVRTDHMDISHTSKTIWLPVRHGADLSDFDPMLYGMEGTTVSPAGPQDFTSGSVSYTFSRAGKSDLTYKVTAEIASNPILPGFHADPEIMFSCKTGKFYCYTTSDGFPGWGGAYYTCYSSPDLVEWTLEGTVLDLASNQVAWANGSAWAPAIDEKMIDGEYRYFYYFSGQPVAGGGKEIGVAVSASPVGPFVDHGSSIIASSPTGGGQQIDVDVFTDPTTGKSYIYWGNGYMAGAELADDMVSLVPGTTKVMTPAGGSLQTYAYREAPYVIYRNGLYYFFWSVDDTGSANYHVAYGTSTEPLGTITVAKDPIVLIQDPGNKIYGTAHNSILQIPGKDEWYIVYHRINRSHLSQDPGIHRETCIDRLYFNEDGTIKRVVPSHFGVAPVDAEQMTGVDSPLDYGSEAEVVSTAYYTIGGAYVGASLAGAPRGIYIARRDLADKSVRVDKVIK